ncbi:NAD-dependent epimerase/dehydratase family protein [Mycolicibacterium mageritense]|uniref:NAD-dependent epimerase/dehydratase family protein n=1 Tax=Mycolicibacterium mageritense TaxID=53462 RepID=UPI001E3BB43E|nr:NAD-dependent epimerase/dehydratase family protein [Mycolicibacterium mageritense]GJJ21220.1 UDP-glucose 4-epimerase [Mycolicibacterium mageritense]
MKVFVTGATGFAGSAIAGELLADGHEVYGLARTPDAEQRLHHDGIHTVRGDLDDHLPDALAAANAADAMVFAAQIAPAREGSVVSAFLDVLAGKTFLFVSGSGVFMQRTAGAWSQDSFAEDDLFDPEPLAAPRVATEVAVRTAAEVRTIVVRPPYLWGPGEHGHLTAFYRSFALTGAVCYIGQGLNCYSHLHVDDAARLIVDALKNGTPGALYHGVAGEIPNRWIAETVAADLGCSTRSITMDVAAEVWGGFDALIMGASSRSRSPRTYRELDWAPKQSDLLSIVGAPHLRAITARLTAHAEQPHH